MTYFLIDTYQKVSVVYGVDSLLCSLSVGTEVSRAAMEYCMSV